MKLYTKKEFFELQTPIVYSYYRHGTFDGLYECFDFIKRDDGTICDYGVVDLLATGIMPQLSSEKREAFEKRYNEMSNMEFWDSDFMESGNDFEMDLDCGQRDGCYDDKEMFVVYSKTDLLNLINKLQSLFIAKYTI